MKNTNTLSLPQVRSTDLLEQKLIGEILIYDLLTDKAFCLNETSALVWQMADGKHSISEITQQISQKLYSTVPESVVYLALDQFKKDNLLADGESLNFGGMSRREIIKKAGLAVMIALPLITPIFVPTAASAVSFTKPTKPVGP